MDSEILKDMYEKALGKLAAEYLGSLQAGDLAALINREALSLLAEIKAVLDDDSLEDPNCFFRIDALVEAFHARGIPTDRHDW